MPSLTWKSAVILAIAALSPLAALAGSRVDDAYRPPNDGSGSSLGTIYESDPSGGGGATTNGGDVYYPSRDPRRANDGRPAHSGSGGAYSSQGAYSGQGGAYSGQGGAYSGGGYGGAGNEAYRQPNAGPAYQGGSEPGGYGEPYHAPGEAAAPYDRDIGPGPRREYADQAPPAAYERNEIVDAGHQFFGSVSQGLANVIEYAFQRQGRPNGYILGEDAGGAFVAGLRYGEGKLFTKDAGQHKVYWQGPSLGYDFGAEGSKTMVLVYNLRDPREVYHRFGGVQGSAYLVGGVSIQFQKYGDVILAPIRSGVGLRLGANVGYLKYTRTPTWNPF
jgi:hypothetical protein